MLHGVSVKHRDPPRLAVPALDERTHTKVHEIARHMVDDQPFAKFTHGNVSSCRTIEVSTHRNSPLMNDHVEPELKPGHDHGHRHPWPFSRHHIGIDQAIVLTIEVHLFAAWRLVKREREIGHRANEQW